MPKCGNCHQSHATVADIKACYAGVAVQDDGSKEPYWPASDKQVRYALGLQEERNLPEDYKVKSDADFHAMERDEVSAVINLLKTFTRKDGAATERKQWTMPEGRYALRIARGGPQENDHVWCFYQVDKPTEGRWTGYTFIKRLIGSPGTYRKENMAPAERNKVLDLIENDPNKAMTDYGLQSGVCGKCGSPLTNPESLARGIGPICLGKMGW